MKNKNRSSNLKRFDNAEQLIMGIQFRSFAKGYFGRLTDLMELGLSSAAPIWSDAPDLFGFDRSSEADFRATELHRVERSITDWPCTPEGAEVMRQRLNQHERYKQTGNPADAGLTSSDLHLEQLRKADLGAYARMRGQLEQKVLDARRNDMILFGFSKADAEFQIDSLKNKRAVVCDLVEELSPGFKREPKSGGYISFGKRLCDGWLIRIKIVESDLLRTLPCQLPGGWLHIATNKFHLEIVDEKLNRFTTYSLDDLVPIKNSLSFSVFSRVYGTLDQLLFAIQASVACYHLIAEEFEACLLLGIKEFDHVRS